MTDLERLLQSLEARAAGVAAGTRTAIDNLALAAFERMWRELAVKPGVDVRVLIERAQVEFGGAFADSLAQAFSELLQRSIAAADVRALPVGGVSLSRRLYLHALQTTAQVTTLIREHAKGLLQARELSMRLYDGYDPRDGLQRPLEGSARAELPKALRQLTEDTTARNDLTALMIQGQKQAARLKSVPLRAGYMEAFDAWKAGAGQDALRRRLEVAQKEKNRFFADRIAQTELHRAHQAQVAREIMDDDLTTVVQVRMNPTHPRPDICDLHATADLWGLGPGCYPKERAPVSPYHPFCRCRLKIKPALDASNAVRAPNGEAAFLRLLGEKKAAEVMGSRERAERVLSGKPAQDVIDAGVPAPYRLATLEQVARRGHPLLPEGEPA